MLIVVERAEHAGLDFIHANGRLPQYLISGTRLSRLAGVVTPAF
jgi:hypothetical protein